MDDVPWNELATAYGPASDIPYFLRKIAEEKRTRVWLDSIEASVAHQGGRYEAAAFTAPFLIQLLPVVQGRDQAEILHALRFLVAANFYIDCGPCSNDGTTLYEFGRPVAPQDLEMIRGDKLGYAQLLKRIYEAAETGIDSYISLLDSGHVRVRCAAAHLLACFPLHQRHLIPELERRLTSEGLWEARACCSFALAWMGRRETLKALMNEDVNAKVRTYAAIMLAVRFNDQVSLSVLASHIQHPDPSRTSLSISHGSMDDDVARALCKLEPSSVRPLMPSLLANVARSSAFASAVMHAAFYTRRSRPFSAGSLNEIQRSALTVLTQAPQVWLADGNGLNLIFREYGLPERRVDMVEFLGVSTEPDTPEELVWKARSSSSGRAAVDAYDAALALQPSILDKMPDPGSAHLDYARSLAMDPGRLEDALSYYEQAAALIQTPDDLEWEEVREGRAEVLVRLGRYGEALAVAESMITAYRNRMVDGSRGWCIKAEILVLQGRLDEALIVSQVAAEHDTTGGDTAVTLGWVLALVEDFEGAQTVFDRLAEECSDEDVLRSRTETGSPSDPALVLTRGARLMREFEEWSKALHPGRGRPGPQGPALRRTRHTET